MVKLWAQWTLVIWFKIRYVHLVALITVYVIYDMARVQRDYLISIFNDLKACYDRVGHFLNTVTTRRIGLPKSWLCATQLR